MCLTIKTTKVFIIMSIVNEIFNSHPSYHRANNWLVGVCRRGSLALLNIKIMFGKAATLYHPRTFATEPQQLKVKKQDIAYSSLCNKGKEI